MIPSLRRRLILILSASVVGAWLATALFTYWDTKREINIMLDGGLVQSAQLIGALLEHTPVEAWERLLKSQGERQDSSFRIRRISDDAVVASFHMPVLKDGSQGTTGFQTVWADGEEWRLYRLRKNDALVIEVAQPQQIRAQLAGNVASHIIHPVWFAVPLLAFLIWLSVRWGLSPLNTIVREVEGRTPDNLAPLTSEKTPQEILPLTKALNSLFIQMARLLEKKRRFTDDAAHELRTPLAVIKTHAQLVYEARNLGERDQAIQDLRTGTDRAVRLVNQLLVLARLDSQSRQTIDESVWLNDILAEAIITQTPSALAKEIDLGLSGEEGERVKIKANGELIKVLLANLISNAVRYSPPGGDVTVYLFVENDKAVLQVDDSGPGIAEKERERVFERFYRIAGNREEGCGLGLSIVARIVEIYNADLHVENIAPKGGLRVQVRFSIV